MKKRTVSVLYTKLVLVLTYSIYVSVWIYLNMPALMFLCWCCCCCCCYWLLLRIWLQIPSNIHLHYDDRNVCHVSVSMPMVRLSRSMAKCSLLWRHFNVWWICYHHHRLAVAVAVVVVRIAFVFIQICWFVGYSM